MVEKISRVARLPVRVPQAVTVALEKDQLSVKGAGGTLHQAIHRLVTVNIEDQDGDGECTKLIRFAPNSGSKLANALAGTHRALVNNMVIGVTQGFERQLELVGVGYRAQAKQGVLTLNLGYSHPVLYRYPNGVSIETPKNTVIVVKAIDKQLLGQVCAEIRAYRKPEPYKGKGVRYKGEHVIRKEAKKK